MTEQGSARGPRARVDGPSTPAGRSIPSWILPLCAALTLAATAMLVVSMTLPGVQLSTGLTPAEQADPATRALAVRLLASAHKLHETAYASLAVALAAITYALWQLRRQAIEDARLAAALTPRRAER